MREIAVIILISILFIAVRFGSLKTNDDNIYTRARINLFVGFVETDITRYEESLDWIIVTTKDGIIYKVKPENIILIKE